MTNKRPKNSSGSRKRTKNGVTSVQYIPSDEDDEASGSKDNDYVRTWGLRPAGNGRYGGRRKTTRVTEMRANSPPPTEFDSIAPEPETGDVFVQVPDLLQSKKRKRKQRNDSVRGLSRS